MRHRFHPLILKEFNSESCLVRPGIIRMHHQLVIVFRWTSFGQRREYLGDLMHGVEFAPCVENID
jgi:hypothetical protein